MDIEKENDKYLVSLVTNSSATQDEINDLNFDEETGFFESNRLADWFINQINFGWRVWQARKAQAVPQWISTSERMPDEGEEVLVHSLGQVRQVTRDSKWAGGFKERNCYGWQAAYGQSHWMPKSIELPEQYHFYYENDAKQKAMIDEVSQ